jgi:protein-L-isoaspartate O-methyltransferase
MACDRRTPDAGRLPVLYGALTMLDQTTPSTDADTTPVQKADTDAPVQKADNIEGGTLHGASATYSPEDNKLRLYPLSRLDAETYARVKAAGFAWAPRQELFVAPMWTPGRADLLVELCGEIGDEDTSLVDRAEERADRFEGYHDNRTRDAESARRAVAAIADNIPLGQPILIGHHSERHARRDAERIENGMRRAVRMWETASYWTQRAAGAVRAAKYKERADVRARRIKTIEADQRKAQRSRAESERLLKAWSIAPLSLELAREIADAGYLNVTRTASPNGGELTWTAADVLRAPDDPHGSRLAPRWTVEQVQAVIVPRCKLCIAHADRWIAHYANRLAYERAMLQDQGGEALLAPKPRPVLLPLCNYRAPEGLNIPSRYTRGQVDHYPQIELTQAQYARINVDYKGTRIVDNSHRVRTAMQGHKLVAVFLTDAKVHTRPAAAAAPVPKERPAPVQKVPTPPVQKVDAAPFQAMREQLRTGVQVVAAPQLFPTPRDVALRMVNLAAIRPCMRVLEPSAGTGALLDAIGPCVPGGSIDAVEINAGLAQQMRARHPGVRVHCADFLAIAGPSAYVGGNAGDDAAPLGMFDVIVMNPPFGNAADIAHIRHALTLLAPGGRLVAICAGGPRQAEQLQPMATTWEPLPEGTFAGTGVRSVLLTIDRAA